MWSNIDEIHIYKYWNNPIEIQREPRFKENLENCREICGIADRRFLVKLMDDSPRKSWKQGSGMG